MVLHALRRGSWLCVSVSVYLRTRVFDCVCLCVCVCTCACVCKHRRASNAFPSVPSAGPVHRHTAHHGDDDDDAVRRQHLRVLLHVAPEHRVQDDVHSKHLPRAAGLTSRRGEINGKIFGSKIPPPAHAKLRYQQSLHEKPIHSSENTLYPPWRFRNFIRCTYCEKKEGQKLAGGTCLANPLRADHVQNVRREQRGGTRGPASAAKKLTPSFSKIKMKYKMTSRTLEYWKLRA